MLKGRALFFLSALLSVLAISATASADTPRKNFGEVVAQLYADKTFVVSPTSLNVVLHIAKDASRGKTADEIAPLLFDDNLQAQYPIKDTDENLLNTSGVWISSRFPGRSAFDALLSRKYGAVLARVSFTNGEGEDAVGKWIARFSNGDLHGMPLDNLTAFVIANIQVFDGKWYKPFDPKNTKPDTFHGQSGDEPIQMMSESGTFYYAGAGGETVALDYAGPYRIL